jgi:hypothetical protein
MPRIILQNENVNINLETKSTLKTGFLNDRDVLKKRSKKYLDLISSIDTKTISDTKGMSDLLNAIQEEFGCAELTSLPLGIISKCFLGHPYEVHTIDLSGSTIVKHYRINEMMQGDFEKARNLAKHNAYALVEIYKDKIVLIREDGSASRL